MEGFRENLELFVASRVVEIGLLIFDRSDRTDGQTVPAGTTVSCSGGADHKRKICEDGDEANPGPKALADEEIVSSDPPQPGCPCHMLV